MGISVESDETVPTEYVDIERFFLSCTTQFHNSRIAEGFLCWLTEYGEILSPSKIRKLINDGELYNKAVLNGILNFLKSRGIKAHQLKILRSRKPSQVIEFGGGVRIRRPMPEFESAGVLIPSYALNKNKFLQKKEDLLKNNIEIRSRMLFGSVIHSDVFSVLSKYPDSTWYEVSKLTGHHKASTMQAHKSVSVSMRAS